MFQVFFLASNSAFIFAILNLLPTKKYLYGLLGANYIKSKIGKPAINTLAKYRGPLVGLYTFDVATQHVNTLERNHVVKETLDTRLRIVNQAPYFSEKQKDKLTADSLKDYNKAINQPGFF